MVRLLGGSWEIAVLVEAPKRRWAPNLSRRDWAQQVVVESCFARMACVFLYVRPSVFGVSRLHLLRCCQFVMFPTLSVFSFKRGKRL